MISLNCKSSNWLLNLEFRNFFNFFKALSCRRLNFSIYCKILKLKIKYFWIFKRSKIKITKNWIYPNTSKASNWWLHIFVISEAPNGRKHFILIQKLKSEVLIFLICKVLKLNIEYFSNFKSLTLNFKLFRTAKDRTEDWKLSKFAKCQILLKCKSSKLEIKCFQIFKAQNWRLKFLKCTISKLNWIFKFQIRLTTVYLEFFQKKFIQIENLKPDDHVLAN